MSYFRRCIFKALLWRSWPCAPTGKFRTGFYFEGRSSLRTLHLMKTCAAGLPRIDTFGKNHFLCRSTKVEATKSAYFTVKTPSPPSTVIHAIQRINTSSALHFRTMSNVTELTGHLRCLYFIPYKTN